MMSLTKVILLSLIWLALSCKRSAAPTGVVRVASPANVANGTSAPAEPEKKICAAHQLCEPFRRFEKECREKNDERACANFVEIFKKLATRDDCQRSFDATAVPSVWVCDEDPEENSEPKIFERSAKTLSKLNFSFAREFYGSGRFRSVLDGDVAEQHLNASLKVHSRLPKHGGQ